MAKTAKIYDFTLTAGGSFQLPVEGDYVRIMTSTGAVELVTDSYRLGPIAAGQGQEGSYRRMTINDKSGAANVGSILIASAGFIDQRITGEVSVINGEKFRALAGQSLVGAAGVGAVAGQFPHAQLWNPAGSGKNLIVENLIIGSGTAQACLIGGYSAALTTDQTASRSMSKKLGNAVGSAQVRVFNQVGILMAPYGLSAYVQASQSLPINFKGGPFVVPPGNGLTVAGAIANSDLLTNFEWFEETA